MPSDDSVTLQRALTAAQLYYTHHRTMEAIAHELDTSRSTVSRLLSYARSIGIVEVRVRSPREATGLLESEVSRAHRVSATVVPVPDHVSDVDRQERVARAAAAELDDFIESNLTVGVAWGGTIAAVSRHLQPKAVHGTTFVQLNGSGNARSNGHQYAGEFLRRFATAYNGEVEQLPVPAFFDDPETKKAMWRERSTRRVLDVHAQMGLVVFSVGAAQAAVRSHLYSGGYLESSELADLERAGVVGDVATRFFRADGSSDGISLNERSTGPSFERFRRIPRRLCVVSGPSKLGSLRGALAAGLVTDLVVDAATARALVEDGRHHTADAGRHRE